MVTDYIWHENHIFITSNQLLKFLPYEPLPGKAIGWNSPLKMLTIYEETLNPDYVINTDKAQRFSIIAGEDYFYIGERKVNLSYPAMIVDNTLFIPLRGVCEGYGYKIDWNQTNQAITLERNI